MAFALRAFPSSSEAVFQKVLWTGWYDGMTSALAVQAHSSHVWKLDLLAWGAQESDRVFCLSAFAPEAFDRMVALLPADSPPTWPHWLPSLPEEGTLAELLQDGLVGSPEFVLASDAMFSTIYGIRSIADSMRSLIPSSFDDAPFLDNFDIWRKYLGIDCL